MAPKTWTSEEIIKLILDEIIACRDSFNAADRKSRNMAETIYQALNDASLIQDTP